MTEGIDENRPGSHDLDVLILGNDQLQDESTLSEVLGGLSSQATPNLILVSEMGDSRRQLHRAARRAADQDLVLASTLAEGLRTFHHQMAQQFTSGAHWKETQSQLNRLFEELSEMLKGLYLLGELTSHGEAMVVSFGQRLASVVTSQALREKGLSSQWAGSRETFLARLLGEDTGIVEEIRDLVQAGSVAVTPFDLHPQDFRR